MKLNFALVFRSAVVTFMICNKSLGLKYWIILQVFKN